VALSKNDGTCIGQMDTHLFVLGYAYCPLEQLAAATHLPVLLSANKSPVQK
jgi:hypothetical protein